MAGAEISYHCKRFGSQGFVIGLDFEEYATMRILLLEGLLEVFVEWVVVYFI